MKPAFLFLSCLLLIIFFFYAPVFFQSKTLLQTNLLVSTFAPWNTDKFLGWEHGIPFKPTGIDNINLIVPYKHLAKDIITKGSLPLWNPYNFSGNVLLANAQHSIVYPLSLLFLLLPPLPTWNMFVIMLPIMATCFTGLLLHLYGLKRPSVLYGAIVFGLSARMLIWSYDHPVVSHTIVWLPLILAGIEGWIRHKRLFFLLCVALGIICAATAGFLQMFAYVLVTTVVYGIIRGIQHKSSPATIRTFFIVILLSVGIACIQLIPTLELLSLSTRSHADVSYLYTNYLVPLIHALGFFVPDYVGNPATYSFIGSGSFNETVLFITICAFILSLSTIPSIFKINSQTSILRILWFFTIVSGLLGLRILPIQLLYEAKIPIFFTFLPSRIFFVTTFFLSLLSAFGMERLLDKNKSSPVARITSVFLLLLSCFLVWILLSHSSDTMRTGIGYLFHIAPVPDNYLTILSKHFLIAIGILMGIIFISLLRKKIPGRYIFVCILLLTLAEQYVFARKYLWFSESTFFYPQHPIFQAIKEYAGYNRFWSYGNHAIASDLATYYRIYSPNGTDAMIPNTLALLYQGAYTKGTYPSNLPRIDIRIPETGANERMTDDPYRLQLLKLTGTKYVTLYTPDTTVSAALIFPDPLFKNVWSNGDWSLYEYTEALPRVFLSDAYTVVSSDEEALQKIYTPGASLRELLLSDVSPTDVQLRNVQTTTESQKQADSVVITSYAPTTVHITANVSHPQLLFLSDTFYPGWKAYVDNKETTIYRADIAYRAVFIPKGQHTVVFSFQPKSLYLSGVVSLFSLLALAGYFLSSAR